MLDAFCKSPVLTFRDMMMNNDLTVGFDVLLNSAFKVFLGREPDALERQQFLEKYRASGDVEAVYQDIWASDEVYKHALKQNADKLLNSIYQGVFNRQVDESGLRTYTNSLMKGAKFEDILKTLIKSKEFSNNKDVVKHIFNIDDVPRYESLLPHISKQRNSVLVARYICKKYQELYIDESKMVGELQYVFVYRDKKEKDSLMATARFLQNTEQFCGRVHILALEDALFYTLMNWNAKIVFVIAINVLTEILRFVGFCQPIIYMEHGTAPVKRYTYAEHYRRYDYSLLPGSLWVERLHQLYPELMGRVFDIGYPKLSQKTPTLTEKQAYCHQFGFSVDCPIVLFAPTYSAGVQDAGIFNIKHLAEIEGVNILVVPHDGDKCYISQLLSVYPKVAFYDGEESISHHYGFADLLVSDISSTAVEFARLGKKMVCLNTGKFSDYDYQYLMEDGIPAIPHTDKKWDFCPIVPVQQLADVVRKVLADDVEVDISSVKRMCSCYGMESNHKTLESFIQISQELNERYDDIILTNVGNY